MIHYQQKIRQQIVIPAMQFINQEKSGGIVLGLAVVLALVLANSPLRVDYAHFLHHHFGFVVDGQPCLNFSLEHWINDGLMSMFFFVVGLELKREFIGGELRDLRKVTLPVAAAIMGMVFPALLYLVFNGGTPVAHGWGIPMATDIAFALAVVYLLGDRVPVSRPILYLATLHFQPDRGFGFPGRDVCGQQDGREVDLVLRHLGHWRCVDSISALRHPCHDSRRALCHGHPR